MQKEIALDLAESYRRMAKEFNTRADAAYKEGNLETALTNLGMAQTFVNEARSLLAIVST